MKRYKRAEMILFILIITTPLLMASALFDHTQANVWIIDNTSGKMVSSINLNGANWTTEANSGAGNSVDITLDNGSVKNLSAIDLTNKSVLVNNFSRSLPRPGGLISLCVSGLDFATDSTSETTPVALIEPMGGEYHGTVKVVLKGIPARASTPNDADFTWWINGTRYNETIHWNETDGFKKVLYLFDNGDYDLSFRIGQNGNSDSISVLLKISNADIHRDSDSDGIPDSWEIAHGLDPLVDSQSSDSDGDGWSDFDEALRGTDFNSTAATPLDSDNDGWSNFDEELRTTDPHDTLVYHATQFPWVDRPSASRLYEVEYWLSGYVSQDGDIGNLVSSGELSICDTEFSPLYALSTLPSEAEVQAYNPAYSVANLPARFQALTVLSSLNTGHIFGGIRIPAGNPAVVQAREHNGTELTSWSVKAWLDSYPDLTPKTVTPHLREGYNWDTADEWQESYIAYLRDHLLVHKSITLSPETTVGVALMESVIDWVDGMQKGPLVLLGEEHSRKASSGTQKMQRELISTDHNSSLNQLYLHLHAGLTKSFLRSYRLKALALFGTGVDFSKIATTTHALASMLQQPDNSASAPYAYDATAVYLSRLQFINEPHALQEGDFFLTDTSSDYDSDIITNFSEVMHSYAAYSKPKTADSDGDGRSDINDPCPADATNACLLSAQLQKDSDGDGVKDFIDNCISVANANQEDSDGDGFGDACNSDYHIAKPTMDMKILSGSSINFEAIKSGNTHTNVTFQWSINGVVNATTLSAGAIPFVSEGNYTVQFSAYDSGVKFYEESRDVEVVMLNQTVPIANDDVYRASRSATLSVPAYLGVLSNDSDADQDTLSAVLITPPSRATSFTLNPDGSFIYQRNDTHGSDSFTYKATDSKALSEIATVTLYEDTLDDDVDGMPDSYEIGYGFDPLNPNDAAEDADHDGYTNLQEYRAGSDPTNENDTPPDHHSALPGIIMYLLN